MTLVKLSLLHYTKSMDEERRSLYVLLGILAVLAVIGACWRVLSYQSGTAGKTSLPHRAVQAVSHTQDGQNVLPKENISELLEESAFVPSQADVQEPRALPAYETTPSPVVPYPQNRATPKKVYVGNPPAGKRYVDVNFYDKDTKTPTQQPQTTSYQTRGHASPQVNFNTSSAQRVQEERTRALAPYLRPNQQDKARMNERWSKLYAALQRAVAKALTPKSKREEMIEKYAVKSEETKALEASGFAGPFAAVGQQLATQKQFMVQEMGRAFGEAAAQQAGGIMDSFAGEVAAVLNSPNTTAEQKEQQIQKLTQKYQDKMDKLAEKNQYDKFVADRIEQDNKQKEELGNIYPEQREQIGQLIDQMREKDLALATQNLPREEYFNQLAQNEQKRRNGIQQIVVQGGKSVQELHQWEQAKDKEYLKTLAALEEKGEIQSVATVASADDKKNTQAGIDTQRGEDLAGIAETFGEQAKAEAKALWDSYEQKLHQIDNQKLSPLERAELKQKATDELNRQRADFFIQKIQDMAIPDEQKQEEIAQLRKLYNAI